jgi:hypothetical protein
MSVGPRGRCSRHARPVGRADTASAMKGTATRSELSVKAYLTQ